MNIQRGVHITLWAGNLLLACGCAVAYSLPLQLPKGDPEQVAEKKKIMKFRDVDFLAFVCEYI